MFLVKKRSKVSLDGRWEEIDFIIWWEERYGCIEKEELMMVMIIFEDYLLEYLLLIDIIYNCLYY